jgi:mRNA interferase HigB
MVIYGAQLLTRFAKKHAGSRKPLARFVQLTEAAAWPHFEALKQTFPSADRGKLTRSVIFDIAGNNYRLIALVDFELQSLFVQGIYTHAEYDSKEL